MSCFAPAVRWVLDDEEHPPCGRRLWLRQPYRISDGGVELLAAECLLAVRFDCQGNVRGLDLGGRAARAGPWAGQFLERDDALRERIEADCREDWQGWLDSFDERV